MENKVQYESVTNATVRFNNNNDTTRQYDITAEAVIQGNAVQTINSGTINLKDNGRGVGTFSAWGENSGSFSYNSIAEKKDKVAAFTAVVAFIDALRESVSNSTMQNIVSL